MLTLLKGKGKKSKKESTLSPITDASTFAAMHKIDLKPIKCPKCGLEFTPNIPFCSKDWRGLKCEEHECGPDYAAFTVVPVDPKTRSRLRRVFLEMKAMLE
jgi:hypothetical protein